MSGYHARISPSSAARWSSCTASVGAQDGIANGSNEAARKGTCCHQMLEELLLNPERDPQSYLGRELVFWAHPESESSGEDWAEMLGENPDPCCEFLHTVEVTQELIDISVTAMLYVQERVALTGAVMEVEQRVPIDHITGEPGATGMSDVVLIYGTTVEVIDLKGGRGRVDAYEVLTPAHPDVITGGMVPEVVRPNLQLALYALGTVRKYELLFEIEHVTLTIVQPALQHVSTYSCTLGELNMVGGFLKAQAEQTRVAPKYVPTQDNCHFCRASGNCAAQNEMVLRAALEGLEDATQEPRVRIPSEVSLGDAYELTGLVRTWLKAVEQRVYGALETGQRVVRSDGIGYKLVIGKKGDREWKNPAEVEALMRKMRLKTDQMYTFKLISPAGAEKLAKVPKVKKGEQPIAAPIGTIQWNRLAAQITQDEGKPSIVLETDPRPAVASAADGFGDVAPADDISDLL